MPVPTPFYSRTRPLCESHDWRDWSGYLAASVYEHSHEREYYAIRNAAGLIDISPLFKYEIQGPAAERLVDRIMTRDITRCKVGQVIYSPWCDEDGKMIDDGTIARLGANHFRVTAADPSLRWFQDVGYGLQVEVRDVSGDLAALALQGPRSREILQAVVAGIKLDKLRYFRLAEGTIDGRPLTITRTGYTGDLGYELWLAAADAGAVWDRLLEVGRGYGLLPAGMIPLDIARIEAGLLLIDVDYISAHKAVIPAQKSSPFEVGLGWAVARDGAPFIGQAALRRERENGSPWTFIGVQAEWLALQRLFAAEDLPPAVAGRAKREAVPLYQYGRAGQKQIGQVTSHTFSPMLKEYVGIGIIRSEVAREPLVEMEFTVEYSRERVPARLVQTPFYAPPWKRE